MKLSYCRHRHSHPDHQAPALEIKHLTVNYPGHDKHALTDISLKVNVGGSFALVGSNGAGKSTLFRAVSGLLPIQQGDVKVFGRPLGACHHRVIYLPQRSSIDWQFPISVLDLVLTGRYVYLGWFKRPTPKDIEKARDVLAQLGIADLADRQISQLSGGQQQRVLIARALLQQADLLLLDEPLNAVDMQTREVIGALLAKIRSQKKTVIVATHYYNQEEGLYDGVIYLKDGQQVQPGQVSHEGDCC